MGEEFAYWEGLMLCVPRRPAARSSKCLAAPFPTYPNSDPMLPVLQWKEGKEVTDTGVHESWGGKKPV